MTPFECVKRSEVKKKMRNNRGKAAKQRKKSMLVNVYKLEKRDDHVISGEDSGS